MHRFPPGLVSLSDHFVNYFGNHFDMRVVSLVPSATDLVASLGAADQLVGISHECDHVAAADLPVVTRTRIPSAGKAGGASPREVEDAVQRALTEGRALYVTDLSLLESLRPDVVLAQDICDVCAVSADACPLPFGSSLVRLSGSTLAGLEEDLERVAAALGVASAPARSGMHKRLERIRAMTHAEPRTRPRVVALEWSDPPYLGGHWVPELIELAGGEDVLAQPGEHSRRVEWAEILAAKPDVVVHMPCGYDLEHTVADARAEVLPRLPNCEVWATDADKLFSRCTPVSVGAGAEVLAGILHPETRGPNFDANAVQLQARTA